MQATETRTKQPRRGAYVLPTAFTALNMLYGFWSLTEAFRAGQLLPGDPGLAAAHFDAAARYIGWAVLFDGMDGRIARLMNTSSAFGRELDSMADTISFGIAPAFLAFSWGVRAVLPTPETRFFLHLSEAGWFVSFVFVFLSASRLARFNIQTTPSSPGYRPDFKSFVGLPTPAAAGLVAAIVHFNAGDPINAWVWVPFWLLVILGTSLLMISTWRYYSFKDLDLRRKQRFVVVLGIGGIIALTFLYSQIVLLLIAGGYVLSGIIMKVSHLFRRPRVGVQPKERVI
jgi:CDP-diacylglycerol---serine O-phosphatidyltransferase